MFCSLFLVLLLNVSSIAAGSVPLGGLCSAANNHLDPTSHKLLSECSDATFCSATSNGTCVPRLCRRDEFPFRFDRLRNATSTPTTPPPPLCDKGFFCPDEGSGCKSVAQQGSPCQLNRDEQCAPPLQDQDPASAIGSICLHSVCMYANETEGETCIIENTTYTEWWGEGQRSNTTVSRHNCRQPGLFCDPTRMTCQLTKPLGMACASDVECFTGNCDSGICGNPPGRPAPFATWKWTVIGTSIFSSLTTMILTLTFLRRRYTQHHQKQLREYSIEQLSLRRTIIRLHTTAAAKLSLDDN